MEGTVWLTHLSSGEERACPHEQSPTTLGSARNFKLHLYKMEVTYLPYRWLRGLQKIVYSKCLIQCLASVGVE